MAAFLRQLAVVAGIVGAIWTGSIAQGAATTILKDDLAGGIPSDYGSNTGNTPDINLPGGTWGFATGWNFNQGLNPFYESGGYGLGESNGTAMAAGLCGYRKTFNTYPDQTEKTYTQFTRRRSDSDPYERALGPFRYRQITARHAINTPLGSKVWIEPGECVLYGQGQDHTDNFADTHTDDGSAGDMVMWPPMKSLYRAQGLME